MVSNSDAKSVDKNMFYTATKREPGTKDIEDEVLAAEMAELVRKEKKNNKKKFVRSAAGTVWEDVSLSDWNPGENMRIS